jgi:tetratricopeptide repeat protein 21B
MTKIGRALIKTHDYKKAVAYYESALSNETVSTTSLRYDLGELYYKLKQYTDAERVLKDGIEKASEDAGTKESVRFLVLLSKVYRDSSQMAQSLDSLNKALEIQNR